VTLASAGVKRPASDTAGGLGDAAMQPATVQ